MPDQEFEYDVFLSYTEANKAEAQNLYERLRNEALHVFFAEESIRAVSFLKYDPVGGFFVHKSEYKIFLKRPIIKTGHDYRRDFYA